MLTEAKVISAVYDYYTGKLSVLERDKIRIFKGVPESDCDKLIKGLERNPGSGYLHFNSFLSKHFDKEVGGYFDKEKHDKEWREALLALKEYEKQKEEEKWDEEIEKGYKEQQQQEFDDEFENYK